MTAQEILDEIRMLGGRLEARGDRLHVEVPAGVLGSEHREALATLKPELLALLQTKPEDAELETRLTRLGIRIAIDKRNGEACLVFSDSDAEAASSVAEVYKPFEHVLTDSQKRALLADIEYFERLTRRKAAQT
jgi:hypothetical protein